MSLSGNVMTFICGACALPRKYLLPLLRQWVGRGQQKIEDIPPYCTWTLYTGPPGRGRRDSWHILELCSGGERCWGGITCEVGPPRAVLWSWLLILALLGPCFLPGPISIPGPLGNIPLPGSASHLLPGLRGPIGSRGLCFLPDPEVPRGGYGFSATSPRTLSLVHMGEGVRVSEAAV